MATPQARRRIDDHDVLLLGTIAGFVPDGERVRQAYEAFRPRVVALGVPPEDVAALDSLSEGAQGRVAGAAATQPSGPPATGLDVADLDDANARLLQLVGRFGATRVPSPDLEAAHAAARADGVPLVALDLDDASHSAAYTRLVRFHHVVQSNSIKARLLKRGVDGPDAYAVAQGWDDAWTRPKGLARLEEEREQHMAQGLRAAAKDGAVLAILPSVRLAGVLRALDGPAGPDA